MTTSELLSKRPFQTTPKQALKAAHYAIKMEMSGLTKDFIGRVLQQAVENQGVFELLELWNEAISSEGHDAIVADLEAILKDLES